MSGVKVISTAPYNSQADQSMNDKYYLFAMHTPFLMQLLMDSAINLAKIH